MNCPEVDLNGELCDGEITSEQEGEFVYFTCQKCKLVRVGHISNVSPQAAKSNRLERAGLPDVFVNKRFEEDADNQACLAVLRSWLNDGATVPAPAIWGLPGRGKTHALVQLCRQVVSAGIDVRFWAARALLREFQNFEDHERREQVWRQACSVPVLALDDLGAGQATDWRHEQLAELVDVRYQRALPIVFATNYAPSGWDQIFDMRTVSRLRGMMVPVELKGHDRRQMAMSY